MASNKTYWKNINQLNSENENLKKLEQTSLFQSFQKISQKMRDYLRRVVHLEETFLSMLDLVRQLQQ